MLSVCGRLRASKAIPIGQHLPFHSKARQCNSHATQRRECSCPWPQMPDSMRSSQRQLPVPPASSPTATAATQCRSQESSHTSVFVVRRGRTKEPPLMLFGTARGGRMHAAVSSCPAGAVAASPEPFPAPSPADRSGRSYKMSPL